VTIGTFAARRHHADPLAALPLDVGSDLAAALRHAIELQRPELFLDVVVWAQSALHFRDVGPTALLRALGAMRMYLTDYVTVSDVEAARTMLSLARKELAIIHVNEISVIDESAPAGAISRRYFRALLNGDEARATREVLLALADGMTALTVYEHIFTPVLHEVGRLWERNEIGVWQEHAIAASVERLMAQLVDVAPAQPRRELSMASAALAPAQHDIASRMVTDTFAICGWNATFLGGSVPSGDLLEYVDRVSIDVLALSVTMARDLPPVRALIRELDARPLAPLVIVGGHALSLHPSLWRAIGADGYALTPLHAVRLANELIER